jgi:hypothetical protein
MNKREFVWSGCATLAGLASGASAAADGEAAGSPSAAAGLRLQRLPDLATNARLAAWQAYAGHSFRVAAVGTDVELRLDNLAACVCQPGFEQFSLSFASAPGAALPSGTHVLRHATGQRIAVYLETLEGTADAPQRLRADFNLIT